jgi:hypothetical protein
MRRHVYRFGEHQPQKMNSDYAAVGEQSGLKAGDDGSGQRERKY